MLRILPSKIVVVQPRPGTYPRKESPRDVRLAPTSKLNRYLDHGHIIDTTHLMSYD
jgi:hypothetical protein